MQKHNTQPLFLFLRKNNKLIASEDSFIITKDLKKNTQYDSGQLKAVFSRLGRFYKSNSGNPVVSKRDRSKSLK